MNASPVEPSAQPSASLEFRLTGAGIAALAQPVEQVLLALAASLSGTAAAAGDAGGAAIASLLLDVAAEAATGDPVRVTATVDRATRTLLFAHADVRRESDGRLLLAAQAVVKLPIR